MTTTILTAADLRHFTGTENWYRHALARSVLYTDGIRYVAQNAGAYWLLDIIALSQKSGPAAAAFRTIQTAGPARPSAASADRCRAGHPAPGLGGAAGCRGTAGRAPCTSISGAGFGAKAACASRKRPQGQ